MFSGGQYLTKTNPPNNKMGGILLSQKKSVHRYRFLIALVLGLSLVLGSSLAAFGAGTCTVNAGDTLSKIAAGNQVALNDLIKYNPQLQNLNCIQPGQTIKLPAGTQTATQNCPSANQSTRQPALYCFNQGNCQPADALTTCYGQPNCLKINQGDCPTNSCQPAPAKVTAPSRPAPAAPAAAPAPASKQTPAPASAPTPAPAANNSSISAFEQQVVDLTNAERAKAGLAPLKLNVELSRVARIKSEDMRDKNYFDHNSPTYGSPFDMMRKFGISFTAAGENIAAGQTSPQAVVTGWMNSPGHRQNILNPNYTEIGVGYAAGGSYRHYWTQEFIRR